MKMIQIAILCTLPHDETQYRHITGLHIFDEKRDAKSFTDKIPVITHAPCGQWSRLKAFAHADEEEKELAYFCWQKVNENGGIFEHPSGTSFFKAVGADPSKIISVDQVRFCHPGRKRTLLYFHRCSPLTLPTGPKIKVNNIASISKKKRNETPIRFAKWLVNCIRYTYQPY